jgi:hypothetical protein
MALNKRKQSHVFPCSVFRSQTIDPDSDPDPDLDETMKPETKKS